MKILALDASAQACSVALCDKDALRAHLREDAGRGQADRLLPLIDAALAEAGWTYASLDMIAATIGPGSFTGLRIGLAAAQGIGLAAHKPVVGVTTFEALWAQTDPSDRKDRATVALVDAGRAELFAQCLDESGAALAASFAALPEALPNMLPAGALYVTGAIPSGLADALQDRALIKPATPDALGVAKTAWARRLAGRPDLPAEPMYLRAADVTMPS